jgi:signal transduction histidine kinase
MVMMHQANAEVGKIDEETQARFFNPWVQLRGQVFYFAVLFLVFLAFKDLAPPKLVAIWTWFGAGVATLTLCADALLLALIPSTSAKQFPLWRRLDNYLTHLFNLVTVAAIFLLLPFADPARAMIFGAFIVGYVPMQILSDPENASINQISVFTILGAYIVQLLIQPGWHTEVLAVLVLAYGVMMFFAARSLRDIVSDAVLARTQTEVTSKELEVSISTISAERDARSQFLTSASHDLGQPLHAATLFIEEYQHAQTREARQHAMVRIEQSVSAARAIIGDMLNHARLQADVVVPSRLSSNLGDLIHEVAIQYGAYARENHMTLRVVKSRKNVITDPALLKRAIGNLVVNAITHSGGSRVLIGVKSGPAGAIRVCVLDDGTGVDEIERANIFNDFYQSQKSASKSMSGFGLGLASVKRIMSLLAGHVDVFNLPSGGAVFCLLL